MPCNYEVSRLDLVIALTHPRRYKRRLKSGDEDTEKVDFGAVPPAELSGSFQKRHSEYTQSDVYFQNWEERWIWGTVTLAVGGVMWVGQSPQWGENRERRAEAHSDARKNLGVYEIIREGEKSHGDRQKTKQDR